MKKLLTLILLMISLTSFAQQDTTKKLIEPQYPAYYVVGTDTIGIIITIEQAQLMDNDLDLLDLFEKMKISCDTTIKRYILVVNEYDKQVAILNGTISKLNSERNGLLEQIKANKLKMDNYESDLKGATTQISKQKRIIGNKDKEISTLKLERVWYPIGGGFLGIIGGLLTGVFLIHH
jgi:hypothetical protein